MRKPVKRTPVKYRSLSLPVEFLEIIDEFIKNNQRYRSIAEFARIAMIEKMEREPEKIKKSKNTFKKKNNEQIMKVELSDENMNKIRKIIRDEIKKELR